MYVYNSSIPISEYLVRVKPLSVLILIALSLAACSSSGAPDSTSTPAPADTPVPVATLTGTPTIPLVILILPADLDADTSNLYQKTVYDMAQASGYRFQVRNSLSPDEIEPGLQIVIALPPDPGVAALAAAAPNVQFLAINIPGMTSGGNISALGDNTQPDIAGFLAGYTAALVTDDYRIGMLIPKASNDAIRTFNAYVNGMRYYCGLCRPIYYFPSGFPQYLEIAADENPDYFDSYADILIQQYRVRTIFVHSGVYTSDLVNYIGTTGAYMIGTTSPEQRPAGWVMTIQPDVIKAIQNAWPQLVGGQGGITVQSPLGLSDVDPDILTPGKLRLVEQTLNDLQAGLISIGAGP
jgi:hypothetical protein